ncbi:putative quinol monooxygenase [Poseidonocella sp. HB161398]|uniref:putative quinol monooxygenase n=1 Tax=Poseidonocella sp. HB161398 TaxID=2320855 RepID=UPI001F0DF710|nr:putative quinol monooxygenase [Poseidonocella sp. HB161398]
MTEFCISAGIEATGVLPLAETEALLAGLVRATATEPGCIAFEIRQSLEDPRKFTLWERWTSEAALKAHYDYPHTRHVLETGATRVVYIEKLGAIGQAVPAPAQE